MEDTTDFLKNTDLNAEKVEFLAYHVVTKKYHDQMLDERNQIFDKENCELKEMLARADKSLEGALQTQVLQQERIRAQQETINKLQAIVEQNKNREVRNSGTSHSSFIETAKQVQVPKQPKAEMKRCDSDLDTNVKEVVQNVGNLNTEIKKREMGLRALQEKLNVSQKLIKDYKKKLGLHPDADQETVDKKIREMKGQNLELNNIKMFLRKEMEKSSNLQRKLKDETRKLEHVKIKLRHQELELQQLKQQAAIRRDFRPTMVDLPQGRETKFWGAKQCMECEKPIQPVDFCDKCNLHRLRTQ